MVPCIDEISWLALTIYQEARGETDRGKLGVGFSIMNRVHDPRWPGSVADVIFQSWQYSAWNTDSPTRKNLDLIHGSDPSWIACYREACASYFKLVEDPTKGANHYLNVQVVLGATGKLPSWYNEKRITAVIGRHTFLNL